MGHSRPGRHGLRHRPRQPPQVVLASRTAAAAPARARSPSPSGSSPSCRGRRSSAARAPTAPAPSFDLDYDRPKSIGRLRGFQGNFGVFVRSYAYILSLGGDGLAEASETAVLNANYLLARLRGGPRRQAPAGRLRPPLHARVRPLRRAGEARARRADARPRQAPARLRLPPADRLLPAAGRRGADGRADRDRDQGDASTPSPRRSSEILAEAESDPEIARNAPYTTPVRRLDEASASRAPSSARPRVGRRQAASLRLVAVAVRRARARGARRCPSPDGLLEVGQLLLQLEHRREEVAATSRPASSTSPASKPSESGSSRLERSLDLVPVDGRRDRRPLAGPQRVDGDRRLVLVVLAPVDEDLALAQLLRHLRDDQLRGLPLEQLGDGVGERLRLLVGDLRCSAGRRPGGPSSPRSWGSTRARGRRTARAAAARPAAVDDVAGAPGSRSKASTVGPLDLRRAARARGGARAPPAGPSRPASRGRRRRRSRSRPRCGRLQIGAVFTQSGRCFGQRFSKKASSVDAVRGSAAGSAGAPRRCGRIASAIRA